MLDFANQHRRAITSHGRSRWFDPSIAHHFRLAVLQTVLAILLLTACSGPSTSSGGGQERMAGLNQADRQAFALIPGGFQGKWLKGSVEIQRWDIPVGGAYPDGLIVLGRDTLGQSVTWIAGVMVHEAAHIQEAINTHDGRPCSLEAEWRAIERQIEFDLTIGGNHVQYLQTQLGVHSCP